MTLLPEPSDEVHILHECQLSKAPERFEEVAAGEQPLIAEWQSEPPHSPRNPAFDDPGPGAGRIEPEPKTPATHRGVSVESLQFIRTIPRAAAYRREGTAPSARARGEHPHSSDVRAPPVTRAM